MNFTITNPNGTIVTLNVPNGDFSKFPQLMSLLQPTASIEKKKKSQKKKKGRDAPAPPCIWELDQIPNMITSALARSPDLAEKVINYMLVRHLESYYQLLQTPHALKSLEGIKVTMQSVSFCYQILWLIISSSIAQHGLQESSKTQFSGFTAHVTQDRLAEMGIVSKNSINIVLRFLCDNGYVIAKKSWYTVVYPPPNTIIQQEVEEDESIN